jgi:RimJ/RimL family protein N-acetyltransferase
MYFCKGRFCSLEELCDGNIQDLYLLLDNNKDDYSLFVDNSYTCESCELFIEKIQTWFSNGRSHQFLVRDPLGLFVGTIFFYNFDVESHSVKLSCFFSRDYRKKLLVMESLGIAITFAKYILNINTLTFSVYCNNGHMLNLVKKLGFAEIQPKKGNTDRVNFLISYEDINRIIELLSKLKNDL